jgi:hypothetical protein
VKLPPELIEVLVLSFMNLGTVLAGFMVGRYADQAQKIVVGAFASGVGGILFAGLLRMLGLVEVHARLIAGVFIVSFLLGFVWTWIGYITRKRA